MVRINAFTTLTAEIISVYFFVVGCPLMQLSTRMFKNRNIKCRVHVCESAVTANDGKIDLLSEKDERTEQRGRDGVNQNRNVAEQGGDGVFSQTRKRCRLGPSKVHRLGFGSMSG